MRVKRGWLPPRSPYSLIQEDLWSAKPESEWMILVSCMMLNCTSRKQVEKVLPEFRRRWPTPQAFVTADVMEVTDLVRPLGFVNRRTQNLMKMTLRYLTGPWEHARELPGIGAYAAAAWEIFCLGTMPEQAPKDHALVLYHEWLTRLPNDRILV